jgi:hypothetical protein
MTNLTLNNIFERTNAMFKEHWGSILGNFVITLIITIALTVVTCMIFLFGTISSLANVYSKNVIIPDVNGIIASALISFVLCILVICVVVLPFSINFTAYVIKLLQGQEKPNLFDFKKNYFKIVLTSVLVTLIVSIGLIFLYIPGIYLAIRLFPAVYLSITKQTGPINSIKQAFKLTEGKSLQIFVLNFVFLFTFIFLYVIINILLPSILPGFLSIFSVLISLVFALVSGVYSEIYNVTLYNEITKTEGNNL